MKSTFTQIFIILFICNALAYAQKENNNWYFGYQAGITFNTTDGEPIALEDSQMNTLEGTAVASDKDGNLLFYTNGSKVWTKDHTIMKNGFSLKGSSTSSQSALIIPNPSNDYIFYIFTSDHSGNVNDPELSSGITYSVVDLTKESGNGAVVKKNIQLYKPACEKLGAVKNISTNSYWLISQEWGSNRFFAHKVTDEGVDHAPVISSAGYQNQDEGKNAIGRMSVSPDGTLLAVAYNLGDIQLFNFQGITGSISNARGLMLNTPIYSSAFSEDGTKLYVKTKYYVYQFEVDKNSIQDIRDSRVIISSGGTSFDLSMERGPNGKIYIINSDKEYLDEISYPNLKGAACNFVPKSIYLNGKRAGIGLPSFIHGNFEQKNGDNIEQDITVCEGETAILDPGNIPTAFEYFWYDQKSELINSDQILQIDEISLSDTGDYLCHISSTDVDIDTVIIHLTVNPKPDANIEPEPEAEEILSCGLDFVELGAFPSEGSYSYQWSNGKTSQSINVTESGEYWVKVTNEFGCSDTARKKVLIDSDFENVEILTQGKYNFCNGDSLILSSSSDYDEYLWNTGETTPSIVIRDYGNYKLTVKNKNGCQASDTILISETSFNVEHNNIHFDNICAGNSDMLSGKIIDLDAGEESKIISEAYLKNASFFELNHSHQFPVELDQKNPFEYSINFTPSRIGKFYDTLVVHFTSFCNTTREVFISAEVTESAELSIIIEDTHAITGVEYCIPVYASANCSGNYDSLMFTIDYNPDLFQLTGLSKGKILNQSYVGDKMQVRTLLEDADIDDNQSLLTDLCGVVLLSNRNKTEISISDISTGYNIPTTSELGTLYASDVCAEDMLKLKFGEIPEITIQPNPVIQEFINLEADKKINDTYSISIFNSMGKEVLTDMWKQGDGENKKIRVDNGNFSSGLHYLVISSGSFRLYQGKFMILR